MIMCKTQEWYVILKCSADDGNWASRLKHWCYVTVKCSAKDGNMMIMCKTQECCHSQMLSGKSGMWHHV